MMAEKHVCIKAVNQEIEAFDEVLLKIKSQVQQTRIIIKNLKKQSFSEQKSLKVKSLIEKNDNTVTEFKSNINHYMVFEKILLHLNEDILISRTESYLLISQIIEYFEKKESYEICAAFVKLRNNL